VADHGSHARHDRFAIADAIGGGALPSIIRTCPACGALHTDLLSMQQAIRAAWIPRRTRDLHLRAADAERLRRGGLRWLIGLIGTQRDAITRPLAISFTGLGLAGLLLSTVPSILPMGSAGASVELSGTTAAAVPGAPLSTDPARVTTVVGDLADTGAPGSPVPAVSVGLLGIGSAIFLARRVARRPEGMR
jgi:hypothetical protein